MWMAGLCFWEQCSQFSHTVMILLTEELSLMRCDALLLGEWFLLFQRVVVLDSESEGPIILQNIRHHYPLTLCHIPADSNLQSHCCGNLKFHNSVYTVIQGHSSSWQVKSFYCIVFILWWLVISESLVVASKKVGLAVSAEKTKCMFVSSEQNAR